MITVDLTTISGNIFCIAQAIQYELESKMSCKIDSSFYSYMDCPDYTHAILYFLKFVNIKYKGKVYTYMQGKELADKIALN